MEMLKKSQIPILMKENYLQQVQEERDGNQTNMICRNLKMKFSSTISKPKNLLFSKIIFIETVQKFNL